MKTINLSVDEKLFNLVWRSLHDRETNLLMALKNEPEDSEDAAMISNDLVYLRLFKKDVEAEARTAGFSESAFNLEDGFMDLASL